MLTALQNAIEQRIRNNMRLERKRQQEEAKKNLPRDHDVPKFICIPVFEKNMITTSSKSSKLEVECEATCSETSDDQSGHCVSISTDSGTDEEESSLLAFSVESKDDDRLEDTPIHRMNISFQMVYKGAATSTFTKLHSGQWKATYDDIVAAPELARKWKIVKNKKGQLLLGVLPIHLALKFNAPLKLIKELIRAYPGSLREVDDKGRLPLHHACTLKSAWMHETVSLMLEAYPDGALCKDGRGMLPLHAIGSNQVVDGNEFDNQSILLKLLQVYPEGESIRDSAGRLYNEFRRRRCRRFVCDV